jgi:hypothetical protein
MSRDEGTRRNIFPEFLNWEGVQSGAAKRSFAEKIALVSMREAAKKFETLVAKY